MSIQITNDPLNSFLDNLPNYVLELRRQDAQRDQFNRQQVLREEAAKQQKTLFDLTRDRQKYASDVYKEKINVTTDYRNAKREWQDYNQKNENLLEMWEDRKKAFLGIGAPKSFEDFLEKRSAYSAKVGAEENVVTAKKALAELRSLPDLSAIKPKEMLPPKGLELDASLYGFAMDQLLPTQEDDIKEIFNIFGGTRMGAVPSEFAQQNNIARSIT